VLDAIRAWVAETGQVPAATEWVGSRPRDSVGARKWRRERPAWPSAATVRRLCGSWSEALERAGVAPAKRRAALSYRERVEPALRMAGAGERNAAIARSLGVSPATVTNYLRAMPCRACGAPTVRSGSGYCAPCVFAATHVPLHEPREILARIRDWHGQTGTPPSVADWSLPPEGSPKPLRARVSELAGGELRPGHGRLMALGGALRRAHAAASRSVDPAGRHPGAARQRRACGPLTHRRGHADARSGCRANRRCGGCSERGTPRCAPPDCPSPACRPRRWEEQSIIQALRALATEHGRAPTYAELERCDRARYPSPKTVATRFGSWQAGLCAAGLAPAGRAARWDCYAVIAALRRFEREHGRAPRARDLAGVHDRGRWPSPGTVARRFGSWRGGLRAAGLL
jgi:hypothetical protein